MPVHDAIHPLVINGNDMAKARKGTLIQNPDHDYEHELS